MMYVRNEMLTFIMIISFRKHHNVFAYLKGLNFNQSPHTIGH